LASLMDALVLAQRAATVLCGSINALYFAGYRSRLPRRRVGAWILALVNLAFVVEALYFGVLPRLVPRAFLAVALDAGIQLVAGSLSMLATLAITGAIVARWRHQRRR